MNKKSNSTLGATEVLLDVVRKALPDHILLADMSEFFKVFGDITRIKILYSLLQSELCVHDIASLLDIGQSAVSHQLRILKQSRLVKYRRQGKSVYYSLNDDHVQEILQQGFQHMTE